MKSNRDRVLNTVLKELPSAKVNSFTDDLLPNTVNLRLPIERADDLVVALDLKGVAISSGAACASGKPTPSHVLLALGLSEEEARSSIRISVGAEDSVEELDTASALIVSTVKAMNKRAA